MEKEGKENMEVKSLHKSTHGTNMPLAGSAPGSCGQEGANGRIRVVGCSKTRRAGSQEAAPDH